MVENIVPETYPYTCSCGGGLHHNIPHPKEKENTDDKLCFPLKLSNECKTNRRHTFIAILYHMYIGLSGF